MNPKSLIVSFAPLVLFSIVGHLVGPDLIALAAATSTLIALAVMITGRRHGIGLITLVSTIVFGGLTAVAVVAGQPGRAFVDSYGSGLCALILGAVMLVSALTVPFTERYAREQVPPQYWASPRFRSLNRGISAAWGGAVVGVGLSRLAYAFLTAGLGFQTGTILRLGLTWIVPIVLLWAAFGVTRRLAAAGEQDQGEPAATGQALRR